MVRSISDIKDLLYRKKYSTVLNRIKGYESIEGWLTPREAYGLYNISRKLPPKNIALEIGCWKGKSTFCILSGLKKGILHVIDPFDASGEEGSLEIYEDQQGEEPLINQFKANLDVIRTNSSLRIHRGYSNQFSSVFKEIDLLFIDGDHSKEGCRYDFDTYSCFIKQGGFLIIHDYYPGRAELGPTWVIDKLVSKDPRFSYFRTYDSLWIAKRNQH